VPEAPSHCGAWRGPVLWGQVKRGRGWDRQSRRLNLGLGDILAWAPSVGGRRAGRGPAEARLGPAQRIGTAAPQAESSQAGYEG